VKVIKDKHSRNKSKIKVEKKLLEMFFLFFKIGAFTFGGGYAMIPLIRHELIMRKNWMSEDEFLTRLVIAQSFPGPIVVNFSLLNGYLFRGIKGGLFSVLGAILPSFLIILTIAVFLWHYHEHTMVQAAFMGIRPVVVALIVSAAYKLGKPIFQQRRLFVTFLLFLAGLILLNIHPAFVILLGAILGLLWPLKAARNEG